MENREAIKILSGVSKYADKVYREALTLAIVALEKQEQGRWIPVTERLPEINHFMYDVTPFSDSVLVTVQNGYGLNRVVIGNYEKQNGWDLELLNGAGSEKNRYYPLAWRPLPEAYTEEES